MRVVGTADAARPSSSACCSRIENVTKMRRGLALHRSRQPAEHPATIAPIPHLQARLLSYGRFALSTIRVRTVVLHGRAQVHEPRVDHEQLEQVSDVALGARANRPD